MSINLHCNKINLRQTPTKITYECIEGLESPISGRKANTALTRYITWIKSLRDSYKMSDEDFEGYQEHINQVHEIMSGFADLEVTYG